MKTFKLKVENENKLTLRGVLIRKIERYWKKDKSNID